MKKLKDIAISLLILAVGAGGFAALKASRPQPEPIEVQERTWVVETQAVHPGPVTPVLMLYGRVETPQLNMQRAALEADVLAVHVREGQWVSKDEILVELDQREAALELRQRGAELREIEAELESELQRYKNDRRNLANERALLELTQREVNRYKDLAARQLDTESRRETAQLALEKQAMALAERQLAINSHHSRREGLLARLERARALRELSAIDFDRTLVRAAFDGRVVSVQTSPGDRVRPGDPLISLFDSTTIEVRAQIPTRYLRLIRTPQPSPGQILASHKIRPLRATVLIDELRIEATLQRLSAEVARGRGGADAFFSLPAERANLFELGRTLQLELELPVVQDAITVPSQALYGSDRVYKLVDDRLQAVSVERLGDWRSPDGEIELVLKSAALSADDRIVLTQLPGAVDGMKVRTTETR